MPLPPGFVLDAPNLPPGFILDGPIQNMNPTGDGMPKFESPIQLPPLEVGPPDNQDPFKAMGTLVSQGGSAVINRLLDAFAPVDMTAYTQGQPQPQAVPGQTIFPEATGQRLADFLSLGETGMLEDLGKRIGSPTLQKVAQEPGHVLTGLTEPGQVATLPFAGLKPVQAYYATQTVPGVQEGVETAINPQLPTSERVGGGMSAAENALFTLLLGKGLAPSMEGPPPTGALPSEIRQGGPDMPFLMRNRPAIPLEDKPQFQERPPLIGQRPVDIGQRIITGQEAPQTPNPVLPPGFVLDEPSQKPIEGGKIGFAAPAEAGAIPSARQAAPQAERPLSELQQEQQVRMQGQYVPRGGGKLYVGLDPETIKREIVPAIKLGSRLLVGKQGDTHADILIRNGENPDLHPHESPERGFAWKNSETGKMEFHDRRESEQATGYHGTAKAGGLDSMDLPGGERHPMQAYLTQFRDAGFKTLYSQHGLDEDAPIPYVVFERGSDAQTKAIADAAKSVGAEVEERPKRVGVYFKQGDVPADTLQDWSDFTRTLTGGGESKVRGKLYSGLPFLDPEKDPLVPTARLLLRSPERLRYAPSSKGEYDAGQLVNRLMNQVPPAEQDMLTKAGIKERFKPGEKTTAEEVDKWVQENGPRVEVRKATKVSSLDAGNRIHRIHHDMETMIPGWFEKTEAEKRTALQGLRSDDLRIFKGWLDDYGRLSDAQLSQVRGRAEENVHWSSISPKPESEMPGYVEGAVVLPLKEDISPRNKEMYQRMGATPTLQERGVLHPSTHSFPPNTLVFWRGYMDGDTFRVLEVQSDWGQQVRDDEVRFQEHVRQGRAADTELGRAGYSDYISSAKHPLLRDYNRLALKSIIEHARAEGAKKVSVQDAKSAMMMEGQDRGSTMLTGPNGEDSWSKTLPEAEEKLSQWNGTKFSDGTGNIFDGVIKPYRDGYQIFQREPSQAKGMRLNYDTILPKTMEELTGVKGTKETWGEHKMALTDEGVRSLQRGEAHDTAVGEQRYRKDLIFRNPDGTPKTDASGVTFDISKTSPPPYSMAGKKLYGGLPFLDPDLWGKDLEKVKDFGKNFALGIYNRERAAQLLDAADGRAGIAGLRVEKDAVRQGKTTKEAKALGEEATQNALKQTWKDWGGQLGNLTAHDKNPLVAPVVKGKAPDGYSLVEIAPGARIAVHQDYAKYIRGLVAPSAVRGFEVGSVPVGQIALEAEGTVKRGLLVFDSFHAFKVMRRQIYKMGKVSYSKGKSLIENSPASIRQMVKSGELGPEEAKWIEENRPIANLGVRNGLNVARISEGALGDWTHGELKVAGVDVNVIGRFYRWVFEKLTRGAIMESFIHDFKDYKKNNPKLTDDQVARHVAKQTNIYYGNMQRQGVLKSATARDLGQIAFLAPQWAESLLQSEVRAAKQLTVDPIVKRQVGLIGKAAATGFLAMFAANQLLNVVTRGKPTWENEEEGRKFDAYIPPIGGKGPGFWVSPLSDVAENSEYMVRYMHKGASPLEAASRIGANKMSPLGRGIKTFTEGVDYTGRKLDDTERLKETGKALAPTPLPLAGVTSEVPGQGQRQMYSTLGLKVEPETPNEMLEKQTRGMDLSQRASFESKRKTELKEKDKSLSLEDRMKASHRAGEIAREREEVRKVDINKVLNKPDRQWLDSRGLSLPGYSNILHYQGGTVHLTKNEMDRLQQIIQEEDIKSLKTVRQQYNDIPEENQSRFFSDVISGGRAQARQRLIDELNSKNESNQKKRYSFMQP